MAVDKLLAGALLGPTSSSAAAPASGKYHRARARGWNSAFKLWTM